MCTRIGNETFRRHQGGTWGAQIKFLRACRATVLVLGATTSCFAWRPYQPAGPLVSSKGLPYRLRATMADSSQVELTSPFVRADTLYGRSGPRRDTVALSVTSVRGLERERLSVWRTLGLMVAPAAAFLAVFAIACDDDCGPQPFH